MAQWRKQGKDEKYTEEEIEARLKDELPAWHFEGGWIRRKYKTSGWKATLMVCEYGRPSSRGCLASSGLNSFICLCYGKANESRGKSVTDKDLNWP